ncbi:MAG: GAF domain-containing protein, partial [Vicinamibacteria bacterium]
DRPKRIGLVGGSEEVLRLLPFLARDPFAEIRIWVHDEPETLETSVRTLGENLWPRIEARVTRDGERLTRDLDLVVDGSESFRWHSRIAQLRLQNVKVLNARSARLLWEFREEARRTGLPEPRRAMSERQAEVLASLGEIIETTHLAFEGEELLSLILLLAMESTAADEGSLLLLDRDVNELRVCVAEGIEPELIPKIRIPLGEGIAGTVAKEGRPILISGQADDRRFHILKKRDGIASAVSAPLSMNGSVLGVLNVASRARAREFSGADLDFVTKLASLSAEIIRRAQHYASLRAESRIYRSSAEIKSLLSAPGPLTERLRSALLRLTEAFPASTGTISIFNPEENTLQLAASSARG